MAHVVHRSSVWNMNFDILVSYRFKTINQNSRNLLSNECFLCLSHLLMYILEKKNKNGKNE